MRRSQRLQLTDDGPKLKFRTIAGNLIRRQIHTPRPVVQVFNATLKKWEVAA